MKDLFRKLIVLRQLFSNLDKCVNIMKQLDQNNGNRFDFVKCLPKDCKIVTNYVELRCDVKSDKKLKCFWPKCSYMSPFRRSLVAHQKMVHMWTTASINRSRKMLVDQIKDRIDTRGGKSRQSKTKKVYKRKSGSHSATTGYKKYLKPVTKNPKNNVSKRRGKHSKNFQCDFKGCGKWFYHKCHLARHKTIWHRLASDSPQCGQPLANNKPQLMADMKETPINDSNIETRNDSEPGLSRNGHQVGSESQNVSVTDRSSNRSNRLSTDPNEASFLFGSHLFVLKQKLIMGQYICDNIVTCDNYDNQLQVVTESHSGSQSQPPSSLTQTH